MKEALRSVSSKIAKLVTICASRPRKGSAAALIVSISIRFSAPAFADEGAFYEQCQKFLPIADQFASECLQRARPFGRTFYPSGGSRGERERFSAYFKPLDAPSRFVLGCVLNFKHELSFVGIYYSHKPIDMKDFDRYPIDFVDFDGNVGVDIDGRQLSLIAARQFATSTVPEHLHGISRNCDTAGIEYIHERVPTDPRTHFRYNGSDTMYYNGKEAIPIHINSFFGQHLRPLVYVDSLASVFVDADGVLMLRAFGNEIDPCLHQSRDARNIDNIFFETCAMK